MNSVTYSRLLDHPADATAPMPTAKSVFARVRLAFAALGEGLKTQQRFERLRMLGFTHEEAARRAFDLDVKI